MKHAMIRARSISLFLAVGVTLSGPIQAQEAAVDVGVYSAMEWRSLGPFRGGRSVASAGVTSDPLTYYMGTVGGGVWKTTDAGTSWDNVSDGQLATSSVGALAMSAWASMRFVVS